MASIGFVKTNPEKKNRPKEIIIFQSVNLLYDGRPNCGFLLFLILLGGVDGGNQHYTQASAHIFKCLIFLL